MKKLKIYPDTSVISHLDQQDALERMEETHRLWDMIKAGRFEAVIDIQSRKIPRRPIRDAGDMACGRGIGERVSS
jgi:hypothetical protein